MARLKRPSSKSEQVIGVPLDQLLKIPQGEMCVAFVASEDREQEQGFVVVIDTKDEVVQARKLLQAAEPMAAKNGGMRTTEKFGEHEIDVFTDRQARSFRSSAKVRSSLPPRGRIMESIVRQCHRSGLERTLAETDKYNTLMNRCVGAGEGQPHFIWYADPIALVRRLASGSLAATGLALFPVLGLDGLQAVGGTMTFATGEYDEMQHMHVLLDNPRIGVIDAIGLTSGEMTPEAWVPADCISYSTIHWDLAPHDQCFVAALQRHHGRRRAGTPDSGPNRRQRSGPISNEIVPQLTGRATHVQWVEKPVRINSLATLVGVQLKDPKAAKPILDKILQQALGTRSKSSATAPSIIGRSRRRRRDKSRESGIEIRVPIPCIGIINDYVVIHRQHEGLSRGGHRQHQSRRAASSTSLDFKLIASKISRQPGGDAPGALTFRTARRRAALLVRTGQCREHSQAAQPIRPIAIRSSARSSRP